MDTRNQIDIDTIIKRVVAQMPGKHQAEAARMLGIPRKRFNDYYNGKYNPPEKLLIQMERFLQARGIYWGKPKRAKWVDPIEELPLSERLKLAKVAKIQQMKPRGRPKEKNQLMCPNWDTLTKKIRGDEKMAQAYGLKHRMHSWRVGKVSDRKFDPLTCAMNEGRVSVYGAAELAKLSDEEILAALAKRTEHRSTDDGDTRRHHRQAI